MSFKSFMFLTIFFQLGSYKHWDVESSDFSSFSTRWRPPYLPPPTNEIEITSYALLTYVRRNDIASAIPILKWLVSKQNDLGGYSSTQVRAVALIKNGNEQVALNLSGQIIC